MTRGQKTGRGPNGYYVKGEFVADGSELDMELKAEFDGSRAKLKAESDALQKLGVQLLDLPESRLKKLDLPEKLFDAVQEAKRISNFEGKRRQMQYIGKLMRKVDPEPIQAAVDAAKKGSATETLALHKAEQWRDDLIADEGALERWMAAHPQTDAQHLRSLIRQARKSIVPDAAAGEAQRQSKVYREIFQLVKAALQAPEENTDADEDPDQEK
ncbi:MAG: ribosome biogenesis factor YjgA [Brachymonas sp.]